MESTPGDKRVNPMAAGARGENPCVSPARQVGGSVSDAGKRLGELVHELSNLLDGATRTVGLMMRSGESAKQQNVELGDASRRLATVKTALEQMSGIVHAAVREGAMGSGTRLGRGIQAELQLGDAVRHGVAILEPLAAEHRVVTCVRVDERVEGGAAGPAYALVMNGVRNAIESLASTTGRERRVEVSCVLEGDGHVVLEIRDNGIGPPGGVKGEGRVFTPGFTTKAGGAGIGLSFCRDLVMQHGGWVRLEPGEGGSGAVLRSRFPLRRVGGAGVAVRSQAGRRDAA